MFKEHFGVQNCWGEMKAKQASAYFKKGGHLIMQETYISDFSCFLNKFLGSKCNRAYAFIKIPKHANSKKIISAQNLSTSFEELMGRELDLFHWELDLTKLQLWVGPLDECLLLRDQQIPPLQIYSTSGWICILCILRKYLKCASYCKAEGWSLPNFFILEPPSLICNIALTELCQDFLSPRFWPL